MDANYDLDKSIRKIPDFPKTGILFYDITSVLTDPQAFSFCVDRMVALYRDQHIDAVAGIEARGFIFASAYAYKQQVPLILVRKKGKLPGRTASKSFKLEYGKDTVEVHTEDVGKNDRILVVDDLIATGGTVKAVCDLLRKQGAVVKDVFAVIGLPFLNFEQELNDYTVTRLIDYHGE